MQRTQSATKYLQDLLCMWFKKINQMYNGEMRTYRFHHKRSFRISSFVIALQKQTRDADSHPRDEGPGLE